MSESLKRKMKKFEKDVQDRKSKNLYLSAKLYQENLTGKEIGHIKIFDSYNEALKDGDGREPVPFGTIQK